MEATYSSVLNRQREHAAADWLRSTRRLARIALRAVGNALVDHSRAGLLASSGRRLRRF